MFGIYIYSMFNNRPWYDELYTYYYFVSRGPVYAAIHWPVPNNHMGYSVLAAIVDKFGNNYLGLRGVSVICSVVSLYLIYRLTRKLCKRSILGILGCFMGAYLTYSLAYKFEDEYEGIDWDESDEDYYTVIDEFDNEKLYEEFGRHKKGDSYEF